MGRSKTANVRLVPQVKDPRVLTPCASFSISPLPLAPLSPPPTLPPPTLRKSLLLCPPGFLPCGRRLAPSRNRPRASRVCGQHRCRHLGVQPHDLHAARVWRGFPARLRRRPAFRFGYDSVGSLSAAAVATFVSFAGRCAAENTAAWTLCNWPLHRRRLAGPHRPGAFGQVSVGRARLLLLLSYRRHEARRFRCP